MGFLGDIRIWWDSIDPEVKPASWSQRRPLTEEDRVGWYDAQDTMRRNMSKEPKNIESVRRLIRHRNPVRWYNLQRDFKWVQKEMKKMGLNPEDARYIL